MRVSELLADLTTRSQDAQVVMVETDVDVGPGNVFIIESIAGGNEKSVLLMGKSGARKPVAVLFGSLVEDREQGKWASILRASIQESDQNDGKYRVSIDGTTIQDGFETIHDAQLFTRGFALGSQLGSAAKRLDASNDTPGASD